MMTNKQGGGEMSEEKLYAVKNDEGKYWDIGMPPWWDDKTGSVFKRIDLALRWAKKYDGHVVTLVEQSEKVVLSKEQAEIVENARDEEFPATYISDSANLSAIGEEDLLMKAYVNGYTVEKDKKYNVKVPHTKDVWYYKSVDGNLRTICPEDKKLRGTFTEAEIEHYGLQDCERVKINMEETMTIKYECQDMFSHEVIATFDTYYEADKFMDAAYGKPDGWTMPAMNIVEVTDDEQ